MHIREIEVFQVDLPLHEGRYAWSGGKAVDVFDATIVRLTTETGLRGVGEVCPLGPAYLPAYAAGARAGIAELAPHVLGLDPTQPERVAHVLDRVLKGHPYAKSAIDVACWDLLGQATGMPTCALLGGRHVESVPLYRAISQQEPDEMAARVRQYRAEGYRKFQLKVGADVVTDIQRIRACADALEPGDLLIADANTGWLSGDALRVVRGVGDVDVYIEQPCASYEECLRVRRATNHPFVLDEVIDGVPALLRAAADGAADAVNLKIGKLGGLTRAKQARDLCASLGIAVTIEDSWGGDVATAAIAHLAHSTPAELLLTTTDFNSYVTVSTAHDAPRRDAGRIACSDAPGLGIRLRDDVVGAPVAHFH